MVPMIEQTRCWKGKKGTTGPSMEAVMDTCSLVELLHLEIQANNPIQ